MDIKEFQYDDIYPIDEIQFTILGNDEILRMSALGKNSEGLHIAELFDNDEPKRGGLIDLRFGTTSNHLVCATCGLNSTYCVGHFGHIKLARPVLNIGYIKHIQKILSCVCLKCSKLLIYKNEEEMTELLKAKSGKSRLSDIKKLAGSVNICQKQNYSCGTPVSAIKIVGGKTSCVINIVAETTITNISKEEGSEASSVIEGKKKIRRILTPLDCYNILSNISDIDCMIMGINPALSRPEMMIHIFFPVPPVAVRPASKVEDKGTLSMDSLTDKLADITKANNWLLRNKDNQDTSKKYENINAQLLQYNAATYINNDSLSLPKCEQKSGKPTKSITARIKSKEGRIRGNLMGKRVDFSARSVITPDPSLDINELGMPVYIAQNITFPEVVSPKNINRLAKLVENGRYIYPGANFVFSYNRRNYGRVTQTDLRFKKDRSNFLRYGDIVERHIVNGDIVLFNRQPSLHKLSMMGHRVKVINDPSLRTIRFNPSVTSPYNADYDGDEMNIFAPQSISAKIELEMIADVEHQIINPAGSRPSIGIIQDGIIGAYILTQPETRVSWKDVMNMLSGISIKQFSKLKKGKTYSGTEILSYIIPSRININTQKFVIKNGIISETKGILTDEFLKAKKKNSILRLIFDEYGKSKAKKFANDIQKITNYFNLLNGFTVGVGDADIPEKVSKELNNIFETKKLEICHQITELENNPEMIEEELFEMTVAGVLDAIRGTVSKLVVNNLETLNNFNVMVSSGAKGSSINMGQISACAGQNSVMGKRISKKFNKRTLAYFHQNDDTAPARGFIQQSFYGGFTPQSFIMHNMSSREGMIDTAIKTSESGYMQRRLVKAMEDIHVKYDGTVRNSNDTIIQFSYGANGIDPIKQIEHKLDTIMMSNDEIKAIYKFSDQEMKEQSQLTDEENNNYYDDIIRARDIIRKSQFETNLSQIAITNSYMLPVNLKTIVDIAVNKPKSSKQKLSPKYVMEQINEILLHKNTKVVCMSKESELNSHSLKYRDDIAIKTIFRFALHCYLAPKRCIYEYKLDKNSFDEVVKKIISKFNKAVVNPGEMVGTIAGQSIGEPITQMSCERNTRVHIIIETNKSSETYIGPIGDFIDGIMEKNKTDTMVIGKDSSVCKLDDKCSYKIIGVSSDEKSGWQPISEVSRHPVNGNLVKITTESGRSTTATLSHSFLGRSQDGIVPVKGSELRIGMMVPVVNESGYGSAKSSKDNIPEVVPILIELMRHCEVSKPIKLTKEEINNNIIERSKLAEYIGRFKTNDGEVATILAKLTQIVESDIMWDPIVDLEYIELDNFVLTYVYDFTVPGNESFMVDDGIIVHNTLNTFHHTGIAAMGTAALGVGRIKEILSFSKNLKTPRMELYFTSEYKHDHDLAARISTYTKYTIIENIRRRSDIYYEPNAYRKGGLMERDDVHNIFYSHTPTKRECESDISNMQWVIRMEFDRENMIKEEFTLLDIKSKFCNYWERRYADLKGASKATREILEKITRCAILSNYDNSAVPIIHIRFKAVNYNKQTLIDFLTNIIENFQLKGMEGIEGLDVIRKDFMMTRIEENGELKKDTENTILLKGVNLVDIRTLRGIDLTRVSTNDIVRVYEVYGIEAARRVLFTELHKSISGGGKHNLNFHHYSILVDIMTNSGNLISVDRFGMAKTDSEPLSRASFEMPVEHLVSAAVFGEKDTMRSVSSRIMAGLAIKGGTNMCNIMMDNKMLEKVEYIEGIGGADRSKYNKITSDKVIDDTISTNVQDIFMPM